MVNAIPFRYPRIDMVDNGRSSFVDQVNIFDQKSSFNDLLEYGKLLGNIHKICFGSLEFDEPPERLIPSELKEIRFRLWT